MMRDNLHQFRYLSDDYIPIDDREVSPSALIALLLAVENEHPGTLAWLVRIAALIDDNFVMNCRSQSPERSIDAQRRTLGWLHEFDSAIAESHVKGEGNYAEN